MAILECVPNLSEGRRRPVIARLEAAACSVPGVALLDSSCDPDHNRTVLTLAGPAGELEAAVFELAKVAVATLDLAEHAGIHPRLGVLDVVPFVPLAGASMEDAKASADRTGAALAAELEIPVFLYEHSARSSARRDLPVIRRGGLAALERRMASGGWSPDFGPGAPHPTAGVSVVGARDFLIAYNVMLDSQDVAVARSIAKTIRAANGGLPAVRALGLALPDRGQTQVSMNLLDFKQTRPHEAFASIRSLALERGVDIVGSEFVGLVPRAAIDGVEASLLGLSQPPECVLEDALESAGLLP